MAQQTRFTLDSLRQLYHGEIEKAFANEMKYAVQDCDDRPSEKKARVVTLQFRITPEPEVNGSSISCDSVNLAVDIKASIPTRKTRIYKMKPKQDGTLYFHPDDPEDPEANHLYDDDQLPDKKKGK